MFLMQIILGLKVNVYSVVINFYVTQIKNANYSVNIVKHLKN